MGKELLGIVKSEDPVTGMGYLISADIGKLPRPHTVQWVLYRTTGVDGILSRGGKHLLPQPLHSVVGHREVRLRLSWILSCLLAFVVLSDCIDLLSMAGEVIGAVH